MGCHILLEDGSGAILLEDGASYLLQDGCTPGGPMSQNPQGGGIVFSVRRPVPRIVIPLEDDDEAVAVSVLTSVLRRRKLSG